MNDPLLPLLLILRYMHILGAITLMGGTILARFAVAPSLRAVPLEEGHALHEQLRSRWSKFVMLASALLLISGITNLALAGRYNYDPLFGMNMNKAYHMLVGLKFLLALPIFFVAAVLTGRSNLGKRLQANARFWMNVNLTLALVMVLIGGLLRFVARRPKDAAAGPAAVAAYRENASQALPFGRGGE